MTMSTLPVDCIIFGPLKNVRPTAVLLFVFAVKCRTQLRTTTIKEKPGLIIVVTENIEIREPSRSE